MSVEILDKFNVGPKRCHVISFVASGAEDEISSGLDIVDHFSMAIKSVATSAYSIQPNVDSSGVVSNGVLGTSGMAAGDEMFLYVYGR